MTPDLTADERATYDWQTAIPGFGDDGQRRLKAAAVLVSRVGGVGGAAAQALAAAGVGKLILAHAGNVKPGDLNRQMLMTHAAVGTPRLACAVARLRAFNPRVEIEAVPENISDANAARLVRGADVAVCCAPLFEERLAMNAACVRAGKPMVDGAMHELTGQLTTVAPGRTACLACRVPAVPPTWARKFPVLGAVAGAVGMLAAAEVVKLLTGVGEPLLGRLLTFDLRDMRFRAVTLRRRPGCEVCGGPPG